MTFKEKALQALKEQEKLNAQQEKQRRESHIKSGIKELEEMFGVTEYSIEDGSFVVDGVKMLYENYYDGHQYTKGFLVAGVCPMCNEEALSFSCRDLEDVGRVLKNFIPNRFHRCGTEVLPEVDPMERIAMALELIAERLEPEGEGR